MTDKNENKLRYSTIKDLEYKARQGDVRAITQLYEMYRDGIRVELDSGKAERYLVDLANKIKKKKPSIDALFLKDFRCFASLESTFHSSLTVFVGGNGSGKTTILESLCLALKLPLRSYRVEKANASTPEVSDIKHGSEDYCDISVRITINDFEANSKNSDYFQSSFVAKPDSYLGDKSGQHTEFRLLGDIYRYVNKQAETFFPFFYYYSIKRISASNKSLSQIESDMFKDKSDDGRLSVLYGALDGSSNISNTLKFFIQLDGLSNSNKFKGVDSLQKEVEELELFINALDKNKVPEAISQTLRSKKESLAALQEDKENNRWHLLRNFVIEAVKSIVSEVEGIFIDRTSGKPIFKVKINREEIEFDQLSAGFQVLTGLAMDIALRMAWLNPKLEKPLEVSGVILIDEIELHLHPEWQQRVILDLQRTFPNIQFILTTHSPQVLSTVDKDCIRKLEINNDGEIVVETPSFQTRGVGSMDILNRIMNVSSTPNVPEHQLVLDFSRAIVQGEDEEAELILARIINHFGEDHPVVRSCESQQRIEELKRYRKDSNQK